MEYLKILLIRRLENSEEEVAKSKDSHEEKKE